MQKADKQLILFALAVCVTCSVLLSAIAAGLRDQQARQVELDRKMNVLGAFGIEAEDVPGDKLTAEDVDRIFQTRIKEIVLDPQTGEEIPPDQVNLDAIRNKEQLPLFLLQEDGETQKYAFPTSGPGLWSTVYGFLALESDLATIAGITFFRHGETPGLGGEVDKDWFQNQFEGKKLFKDGEPVEFQVVKGGVESRYPDGNDHAVDGISGATITSDGVADFINEDFRRYNQAYFERLRS